MKVFLFAISNSGHMFPSCSIGFQDGWHVLSNDIAKIKKKKIYVQTTLDVVWQMNQYHEVQYSMKHKPVQTRDTEKNSNDNKSVWTLSVFGGLNCCVTDII